MMAMAMLADIDDESVVEVEVVLDTPKHPSEAVATIKSDDVNDTDVVVIISSGQVIETFIAGPK